MAKKAQNDSQNEPRAREQFANTLAEHTISLFGARIVESSIAGAFPSEGIVWSHNKLQGVDWGDDGLVQKVIGVLLKSIGNFVGFVVCENIVTKIYREMWKQSNESSEVAAILDILPETYLEKERVLRLSRTELEKKVLEKVDELRRLNDSLEQEVQVRTKELAATNEELKVRNDKYALANERLRVLDQMKSEFVSIAAHQLRTPLSAVKWALQMVLDGDAGELSMEQANLLKKGYANNERMITLVDGLLNVHRIETGKQIYTFQKAQIEDAIANAIEVASHSLNKRDIRIIFDRPETLLPRIVIDEEKIRSVIEGLLDNALKYMEKGFITVGVEDITTGIEIRVQDTGIGIPENEAPRIFSKFFRGSNAVKLSTEGSGLGLFIAKSIIERHQGTIHFVSKPGDGTTFFIRLPFTQKEL